MAGPNTRYECLSSQRWSYGSNKMAENHGNENELVGDGSNGVAHGTVDAGVKLEWVSPEMRTASIALTADQGGFGGDLSTSTS